MKIIFACILIMSLPGCDQYPDNNKKSAAPTDSTTAIKNSNKMSDYTPSWDKAVPLAKKLMKEEFYFSPVDETAPFGNDDGADTYAGFKDWRQLNKDRMPKDYLVAQINKWDYPLFDLNETNLDKLKPYLNQSEMGSRFMSGIDAAIISIAFGQLYLEGTIDKEFNGIAKTAIRRELLPGLLALWGDTYKNKREAKLRQMLAALEQVN
jgi:uncharacterized protein YfeS